MKTEFNERLSKIGLVIVVWAQEMCLIEATHIILIYNIFNRIEEQFIKTASGWAWMLHVEALYCAQSFSILRQCDFVYSSKLEWLWVSLAICTVIYVEKCKSYYFCARACCCNPANSIRALLAECNNKNAKRKTMQGTNYSGKNIFIYTKLAL